MANMTTRIIFARRCGCQVIHDKTPKKDVHVPQSETAGSYTALVPKILNRIEREETAAA
jgi:hypothetical protein